MGLSTAASPRRLRRRPDYLLSRLLLIVAAVAVPLVALQAVSILEARSDAERRALQLLRQRAADVAEHARDQIDHAEHLLTFLATRQSIRTLDVESCENLVRGVVGAGAAYTNIGFFRQDGSHVCSAQPVVPRPSFADIPWFRGGMAAEGFLLSEPRRGPVSGRMVTYLTLPVRSAEGRKVGLVVAVMDMQGLNTALQAELGGPGSTVALVKDRSLLITRLPDPERWMGRPVPMPLDMVTLGGDSRMVVANGVDGQRRAFASAPVGKHGLDALAGMPVADVYARADMDLWRGVLAASLVISLGLAAAFLAARRLTAALRSIADTARRLQAGETEVQADASLPGQFGEVAAEINRLIERNALRTGELEASEQRAVRLRRFYEALSATGQAIARQVGTEALFDEVCRACMASGLAERAWVTLREPVGLRVISSALRRGRPAADRHPGWAARDAALTQRALQSGQAAIDAPADEAPMAAVPITVDDERIGVLTLCAARGVAFDDELVGLLGELARELSFGVSLDRHKASRAALASAQAANRAKTRFLSHVSHELRTPLNAVLGFAQLQHARATERGDEEAGEQLGHVLAAARQLTELIDDLMDVSRIEAGELTVELSDVDVMAKLASVVQLSEPLARRQQVRLSLAAAAAAPLLTRTDPVRLRQVLMNLVSNAIKYNRPGGRVRADAWCEGGRVLLQVEDTGLGMSPQQLEGLFQAFNRLGRERSAIEGTGIGLFITKRLVELLGGELQFDSREGQGTTVTVSLPYVPPEGAAESSAFAPLPLAGSEAADTLSGTVLYIEDNPVNAMLVETYFQQHSQVRVVVSGSGHEGLQSAAELQPDLVLLDMQLPDMHGLEVLQRLAADPRTAALPVIALSASAMPQEVEAATRAGAQAYWTKPIDFARLRAGVAAVLARGRGAGS
ncbi:ATP-binding protein [Aquincola tertiaricarbonis]|uniref:histidine kinase n=1 Tax=Aquincola tertiaricarbonis TaxID=391953 RepID=A0ABY4S6U8_AQUTE|nr:ATP-binding protein [Aquincola tertiaricarbonis]URI09067.1 ATP-binding protein [Aquincola tertiaricarbonis]